MDTIKLGFIGAGNMASAMLGVLLDKKLLPPGNIMVADPDAGKLIPHLARGVQAAASNVALVEACALVILAVKPQVMGAVLDEIAPVSGGRHFISIAAGLSSDYIRQRLAPEAQVVRVMPNTPLMLGLGATVIAQGENLPQELLDAAKYLFSHMGLAVFLPESLLNEVIAVNGTSPAFFFRMADVMAKTAVAQGIPYDTALKLAAQAMHGSAQMLLRDKRSPAELARMVASPGGTTEAALASLDESHADDALRDAMLRCTQRAYELAQSK
ncbi:MAG: pyrroline-5-carboxylate reductase [Oscillospiraceae bacterium]|nr:pyrroline-5-carboxylate reductase [Oscillospiraceae bacterium]